MHPVLRLFEDIMAGGSPDVALPALPPGDIVGGMEKAFRAS